MKQSSNGWQLGKFYAKMMKSTLIDSNFQRKTFTETFRELVSH